MVFASAKTHEKQSNRNPDISGEWKGSYSMQDGPLVNDIFFDFVKGQFMQVFDGSKSWGDEANGQYTMTGDSLVGTYVFKDGVQNPVEIKARLDSSKNQLTGTWKWIKGKGRFVLKKGMD
jgi:hypothetical protein